MEYLDTRGTLEFTSQNVLIAQVTLLADKKTLT